MARKKRGRTAMARFQKNSVAIRKKSPRRNPNGETAMAGKATSAIWDSVTTQILPGFAGYAATRFVGRMAWKGTEKKWPGMSKHAGVLGNLVAFLGALFVAPKIKRFENYAEAATVGAGIALLQTLVQTYLPMYGWVTNDYADAPAPSRMMAPMPQMSEEEFEEMIEAAPAPQLPGSTAPAESDEEDFAAMYDGVFSADSLN